MLYSFRLEWEELPRELREEKIDDYIRINADGFKKEDELLQDKEERFQAERDISAHFPIYF